jgi:hypothetical protein
MVFSVFENWIIWSQLVSLNLQTRVHYGPLSSVYFFFKLSRVELDHTSKRESVSHNLFYKCVNRPKFLSSKSICFKGPNRAIQSSFQIAAFPQILLSD